VTGVIGGCLSYS